MPAKKFDRLLWNQLDDYHKGMVHQYMRTLLAEQLKMKFYERMKRPAVEEHTEKGITYRLEFVKCGKEKCHCVQGKGHGPYWYAYWRSWNGKVRSKYIGKNKKVLGNNDNQVEDHVT